MPEESGQVRRHVEVEATPRKLHIAPMPKTTTKTGPVRTPRAVASNTYRGIKLAPLVNPPRTSAEILDRAVVAAFGKHARGLVDRK